MSDDIDAIRELAESGDIEAQYLLGCEYRYTDSEEAIRWLSKAALKGHIEAQFELGNMYFHMSHEEDYNYATFWFKQAAVQGHSKAMAAMGTMCRLYGEYNRQNYKQAIQQAIQWYIEAFKQGMPEAREKIVECMCSLGDDYYFDENYADAMKWYIEASKYGNSQAQFQLGLMYYEGKGVDIDYHESFTWFSKSAEQGYSSAQFHLGLMYYEGKGVEKGLQEALVCFSRSAENGNPKAQYRLGLMYRDMYHNGLNVIFDAYIWLYLSYLSSAYLCKNDAEAAKESFIELEKNLSSEEIEGARNEACEMFYEMNGYHPVQDDDSNPDFSGSMYLSKSEIEEILCGITGYYPVQDDDSNPELTDSMYLSAFEKEE